MSLEILQQAVAVAGLDKEKLRAAIASTTFDTINGPVKFEGCRTHHSDLVPADPDGEWS